MTEWFCDACGVELHTGPRRRCAGTRTGMHRISRRQLRLQEQLARLRFDALTRARRAA